MARLLSVSTRNAFFQQALALKTNREKRQASRQFFVEGVALINSMLHHRWPVRAFLFAKGAKLSGWATGILASSAAPFHYQLAPALLEELSDKEETSELLAIAELPEDNPSRLNTGKNSLVVAFDRPSSPGNLGSSIRSCDAFGADGVIVTGHAADVYHPQAVRGTMGALFARPIVRFPSHKELQEWLREQRGQGVAFRVVGTSAKGEKNIDQYDFGGPTLLVMGNETYGMSKAYWELCDEVIRIPIRGATSSLNISCAASIVLYEINRQRGGGKRDV